MKKSKAPEISLHTFLNSFFENKLSKEKTLNIFKDIMQECGIAAKGTKLTEGRVIFKNGEE